jgi:hypothetical protein
MPKNTLYTKESQSVGRRDWISSTDSELRSIPRDNMNIVEVLDKHKSGWKAEIPEASVAVRDEAYNTSGVESRMPAFARR